MLPGLKKRVVNLHDVLMYVAIARKHVRLMILLLCFCWLGAVVYYVYSRPVYMSRALIKTDVIDRNKTAEVAFQERGGRVTGVAAELMQPHIVERAAARLGVKASYRDIQAHYVKKIIARRNSENDIELEVYPYSFDWAKRWSETLVREYLDYKQQRRRTEMDQRAENYFADRKKLLEKIEADRKLTSSSLVETELHRRRIDFSVLATTPDQIAATKRKLDSIRRAQAQLLSPELDTVGRMSIISAVTGDLLVGSVIPPEPTTVILPSVLQASPEPQTSNSQPINPSGEQSRSQPESLQPRFDASSVVTPQLANESNWRDIVRQINILESKKSELLRDFQPGHRTVIAVQDQIDELQRRLEAEEKTSLERLKLTYAELTQKHAELEKKLPEYEKALSDLSRARDDQGLATTNMQQWLNQLKFEKKNYEDDLFALDRDRIKILYSGLTQLNENPVSPNRFGLLLYATILGLMLAVGVPFLIEYLDHTLSNMEEVEAAFQLRGLGIIPKLGTSDEHTTLLDRAASKETNLLENFRVIRTNLLSMGSVTKPPHVIIVTSAMPKEGKTFVSSNLALSFAQTGAKTLLMDTDLRRGRLHRLFGYRKQPGLSGVLLDQVSLDEAIRPTPSENLFMLSAGQHLETGTELLGSQKFLKILDELKTRFERIVMDTPPVLGLSETSILQNHVDGVLFVIWSGQTPIKSVKAAIEILQANGANFYGFVLNRLDLSATANYYQYYYYSHDYYYQYSPRTLENRTS
jgi:polysaccharide biosynthesis transport protein